MEVRGKSPGLNVQQKPETTLSGIPLILGLQTRMSDPYVHVVFWALTPGPQSTPSSNFEESRSDFAQSDASL